MSSAKSSKSDRKKDDKKIVVSFTSDSDDDDNKSSSSLSSSESSSAEERKGKSSVVAARKSTSATVKKDSNESKPAEVLSKPSSPSTGTKSATDQQQQELIDSPLLSANEQEKPTSSTGKTTTKTKTKETRRSVSDARNDNGTASPGGSDETPTGEVKEVKTKKKSSTKSESSSTINGSLTVCEVESKASEKEPDVVVVKTITKTKKKTSKTIEAVENGDADITKASPKKPSTKESADTAESENVKNNEKPLSPSAIDESNGKPVKKTTKKSSKTSTITVIEGETNKTTVVEDLNEKLADEKKASTKSTGVGKDNGFSPIDTAANKLDKDDSLNQVEEAKQTITTHSKEQDVNNVAEKNAEKPKAKKKKEKVIEVVQENGETKTAAEATTGNSDIQTGEVKIVRKKKVKKVVPVEVPEDVSPAAASAPVDNISVPTSITSLAAEVNLITPDVVIDKSDLDADREVQSICDAQFIETPEVPSPIVHEEQNSAAAAGAIEKVSTSVYETQTTELSSAPVQIDEHENESIVPIVKVEKDEPPIATTLQTSSSTTDAPVGAVVTTANDNRDYLTIADKNGPSTENEQEKSRVNEESDFSYRRKSMDDFIKRILAEAREEQQKRTGIARTVENSSSSSLALDADKSDQTNGFTAADSDPFAIDRKSSSTDRNKTRLSAYENLEFSGDKIGLSSDLDLDEDLAQIKGYFSRRNKPDPSNDATDDDALSSETNFRSRISRVDIDDELDQKLLRDVIPIDDGTTTSSSSYLSRFRQQQQQQLQSSGDRRETLGEDQFCPRRRDETTDVVRGSIIPVRSVIDQQNEVIQQLKTTNRSVDELENEIRSLRETFLDRQARIESLRRAIDAENRVYETEQTAANERIQQQKIPGGHFVRDEFLATLAPPAAGRQASGAGDSLFRPRSGSVSSTTSSVDAGFGSLSTSGSGLRDPFSFVRAGSLKPGSVGGASSQRRQLFDMDDNGSSVLSATGYGGMSSSGVFRRGGSVARERTQPVEELFDGIGVGGGASTWTPPGPRQLTDGLSAYSSSSSSSWLPYSASTASSDGTGNRYRSSYSSGYSRYQSDQNDYSRPPSSYTSSSSVVYSSPSERITSSRLGFDRSYARDAASPSPSTTSERYSSTADGVSIDSSRTRRAQSVFDTGSDGKYSTGYESSCYGSGPSGSGTAGEFQSRFLDKVRGKKAAGEDISSSSAGSGQFKSRFLRTNFDSTSKKY